MPSLGDLIVRVGAEISGFVSAMSTVAEKMDSVGDQVEKRLDAIESVGRRMAVAGAELSATVTLPIVGIGEAALETAGKFEQTQIAFTHFLGSTQAAKNYLAELYNFAKTTPFQLGDVTQGATKLMAMGFAAKEVTPMLRILGDQLSAVGRMDQLGNIILAFGEMKAKGVASMKEIRQMVTDGVIPALRYLSEALGVSEMEVMDMVKKKAIDSGTAIKAITEGMARETGGMMQEQMGSFVGMMSNVKDNVTLTLKAIGDTLIPYAKVFSDFANSALEMVKIVAQGFAELPEPVRAFILTLAVMAAALGPALLALGGMAIVIPSLVAALAPIAAALGVTTVAFLGWTAVIPIALAGLVALGSWISQNWGPIRAVALQAWDGLKEMWAGPWEWAKNFLITTWNLIAGASHVIWAGVGDFVKGIWGGVVEYFNTSWMIIKAGFSALMSLAEKIPGMKKLMSLGDAWKEQQGIVAFNENLKNQSEYFKGLQGEMRRANLVHAEGTEAVNKHGDAIDAIYFKYNRWDKRTLEWAMWLREHDASMERQASAFQQFTAQVETGNMGNDAQALADKMQSAGDMHRVKSKDIDWANLGDATHRIQDIADAYKNLNVESTDSLNKQAKQSRDAYTLILNDFKATLDQRREAWIAMEDARIKATEAADGKISLADKVKLAMEKGKGKHDSPMDLLGKNSFDAFNQGFQSSLQGLMMGTKNFQSAWGNMVQSMLSSWTGSLAQMATKWAGMLLQKLALHVLTNAGIVASDASTAAASNSISLMQHLREITRAATQAAARAWAAVSAIPIIGPALAPAAAAATFVGVMALGAVSAERGADLPNYNTMGVLHPREMVLPREQADVIRGLAKGGGPAGGGRQNNFHGDMNYNAPRGQTFTEKQWVDMGRRALRNRPGLRPA